MKITARKKLNSTAPIGATCICPSCGESFIKKYSQQAFCRTKPSTQCKDKYYNTVDPKKRNNTTRISPASDAYMRKNGIGIYREESHLFDDDMGWDAHKGAF